MSREVERRRTSRASRWGCTERRSAARSARTAVISARKSASADRAEPINSSLRSSNASSTDTSRRVATSASRARVTSAPPPASAGRTWTPSQSTSMDGDGSSWIVTRQASDRKQPISKVAISVAARPCSTTCTELPKSSTLGRSVSSTVSRTASASSPRPPVSAARLSMSSGPAVTSIHTQPDAGGVVTGSVATAHSAEPKRSARISTNPMLAPGGGCPGDPTGPARQVRAGPQVETNRQPSRDVTSASRQGSGPAPACVVACVVRPCA